MIRSHVKQGHKQRRKEELKNLKLRRRQRRSDQEKLLSYVSASKSTSYAQQDSLVD